MPLLDCRFALPGIGSAKIASVTSLPDKGGQYEVAVLCGLLFHKLEFGTAAGPPSGTE